MSERDPTRKRIPKSIPEPTRATIAAFMIHAKQVEEPSLPDDEFAYQSLRIAQHCRCIRLDRLSLVGAMGQQLVADTYDPNNPFCRSQRYRQ